MSWRSLPYATVFLSLVVGYPALAQRIGLNGDAVSLPIAQLEAHPMVSNAEVAPIEIHFSIPSLDIDSGSDGFQKVSLSGLTPLGIAGSPDLYVTGSLIAVPDGYSAQIRVVRSDTREVPNVNVRPAQKRYRCDCPAANSFSFNGSLYRSSGLFPSENIRLEEVGRLQGLHLQRVALYPVQMEMDKKALKVTTDIVLQVSFQKTEINAAPVALARTFYRIGRELAVNGKALGATVIPANGPETMLVVVADSLREGIKPLLKWKRSKGLRVQTVTFSEAGGSPENVKAYIQNYYDAHTAKPTYLLFVGNKETMPPFMENVTTSDEPRAASDYRYALLSGADPIPDALYGRIIADNMEEVQSQVSRWIAYERNPEKNAAWYSSAMMIASDQGFHPSDEDYARQVEAQLKTHTYRSVDEFFQGAHSATRKNIAGALEEGRSWVAYFGHGTGTSWASTNDKFGVREVEELRNTERLPIIIDAACDNAAYVTHRRPFAKAWVTQQWNGKNVGAVAYYGASVSVSWDPPAIMSVGIAKTHFEKPVTSLGGSVLAGQLYLMEKKGSGADVVDNLKWYNLFGDPSLQLRTSTPRAFQLRQSVSNGAEGVKLIITATDPSGRGVRGLVASIESEGEGEGGSANGVLAIAQTNAEGQAQLELKGSNRFPPDTLLTVTGYNAETYQIRL